MSKDEARHSASPIMTTLPIRLEKGSYQTKLHSVQKQSGALDQSPMSIQFMQCFVP